MGCDGDLLLSIDEEGWKNKDKHRDCDACHILNNILNNILKDKAGLVCARESECDGNCGSRSSFSDSASMSRLQFAHRKHVVKMVLFSVTSEASHRCTFDLAVEEYSNVRGSRRARIAACEEIAKGGTDVTIIRIGWAMRR